MPEQFRKLVEQYYRSLSKAPDGGGSAGEKAPEKHRTASEATRRGRRCASWRPRRWRTRQFQGFRARPRGPAAVRHRRQLRRRLHLLPAVLQQVRREDGGQGWWTDYPDADINFSVRLSELTKTRVSRQPGGEPNHLVVRATDDALFQCPFVEIEDAGTASFSDEEVGRLRAYLLKGGFLWSDDFWGTAALQSFEAELARVLPPREYPIADMPPDASDLPDDVPAQRDSADSVDPALAPHAAATPRSAATTASRSTCGASPTRTAG